MAEKKVLSVKSLPIRFPTIPTFVFYLYYDRFHPAGWIVGIIATLLSLVWIAAIYGTIKEKSVTIEELLSSKKL